MKKRFVICLILMSFFNTLPIYASEHNQINNEEIMNQQQEEFGISEFIDLSNEYSQDTLEGINMKEIFHSAITGRLGNTNFFNNFLNILGREFKSVISSVRHYIDDYYHS